MHGGVRPREVGVPHGPRVARDGVRKKQMLDHDIIRLAGCGPQPPDSVPPHMVSHVGLASAGQQLSRGGATRITYMILVFITEKHSLGELRWSNI